MLFFGLVLPYTQLEHVHHRKFILTHEETNNMLSDGEGYENLSVLQPISQYIPIISVIAGGPADSDKNTHA